MCRGARSPETAEEKRPIIPCNGRVPNRGTSLTRTGEIASGLSHKDSGCGGQNDDPQPLGHQHIGDRHRIRTAQYEAQIDGNDQGKRAAGQCQHSLYDGDESLHDRFPRKPLGTVGPVSGAPPGLAFSGLLQPGAGGSMCYHPVMIGKLALTLAVIVLAALFIRHRARSRRSPGRGAEPPRQQAANPWHRDTGDRQSSDIPVGRRRFHLPAATGKALLWATLSAVVTVGAGLYYLGWREARQPVTVILHSGDSDPVIYRVRRHELGEGAFTTLDGTRVTVADSERMEVVGL